MDKIIFLDIDGVLNHQKIYEERFKALNKEKYRDEYGDLFCPTSAKLLNNLIEQLNTKIVISSTWRGSGFEVMKNMWRDRKMKGEVIGVTPILHIIRGIEIEDWLRQERNFYHLNWDKNEQMKIMKKSKINNYIIIDDDSDMTYNQRHQFIHVLPSPRNLSGFNKRYFNKAAKTLNKTIIDLNYK